MAHLRRPKKVAMANAEEPRFWNAGAVPWALLLLALLPHVSYRGCGAANAAAAAAAVKAAVSAAAAASTTAAATTTSTTTTAAPTMTTTIETSTRRTKPLWNQTHTDRLKHDLLLGYDKFARPHAHDTRTEVDLLVVLKHTNVDEFAGIMSIDAWVKMFWTDPKLTWNPTQYGNLSTLYVADHEIWQPDIMLYNSATSPGLSASHYETSQLVVSSDGGVIWVPMTRLEVYCDLDLTNWPFDTHTCEFRMGSWVYDKTHMDIVVHNETFSYDPHIEGEPWEVLNTEFERKETLYACCPELYVDVSFKVTAHRRGAAYHSVITAPLSASVLLLLISFWIPFQRAEKLMLHVVNALILVVTLMYLTHIVPVLTDRTPHVVEFYACTLFMVCLVAGLTVSLMNMTRLQRPWPVPWPFREVISNANLRWALAGAVVEEVVESSRTTGSHPDAVAILPMQQGAGVEPMLMENSLELTFARNRRDWNYLAIFAERVVFLLCFVVIFCFSANFV